MATEEKNSNTAEDRNAIFRVFIVMRRYSSERLRRVSAAGAVWPNNCKVVSPRTLSRNWPDKRPMVWKCCWLSFSAPIPTSAMNNGINGADSRRKIPASQSSENTTTRIISGTTTASIIWGRKRAKYPCRASVWSSHSRARVPAEVWLIETGPLACQHRLMLWRTSLRTSRLQRAAYRACSP